MEPDYVVAENAHRDPKTGKLLSTSFWVCGPQGFLQGPFNQPDALRRAQQLNNSLQVGNPPGARAPVGGPGS